MAGADLSSRSTTPMERSLGVDMINRGVEVREVQEMKPPGFDAPGRSYFARASFSDPDGNAWQLQEVTTRLPGRE
jgi:hypothetical protein